ncbi:hypothetical protein V6Z12_D05G164100 [Gossypium hirsutum]
MLLLLCYPLLHKNLSFLQSGGFNPCLSSTRLTVSGTPFSRVIACNPA